MQKSSIMMLVASVILIAGILIGGCTEESPGVDTSSTLSPVPSLTRAAGTVPTGNESVLSAAGTPAESGDRPAFNESAGPMGTPPDGMQMNGTRPSGTPPDGMQMNGTRPSGTPPDGMPMGGEPPSGEPPSGAPPSE